MLTVADCRSWLPTLPDESAHCCVTSPPYWGLRDYVHADQIGLEPTPELYVATLVAVFAEVRRVLRGDGVLWLNLGDSYTGSANAGGELTRTYNSKPNATDHNPPTNTGAGLKPKDLVGIPWRVAFALQADGWYLRSDIIWHKPNPMPESVTDRPTKAHEYLFMLSKSERYWFDADAIREPHISDGRGGFSNKATLKSVLAGERHAPSLVNAEVNPNGRNSRSVWTIATEPYSGSHFATMPTALVARCIMAGCPLGGTVLDPFLGSGTVGQVAESLGRKWVGCELNPKYEPLIRERTKQVGLPFAAARTAKGGARGGAGC